MGSFKLAGRERRRRTADIPEQFRIRRDKRARLAAEGRDPYPVEVGRTHTLAQIRAAYPDLPADSTTGDVVGVAGRVVFARNSGKLCFATLQEGDGTQLQVMLSLASVGQEALDEWKADVDIGDIVCVHGEVISSRRGELSVLGDSWQMASKALRPLPVAHKEMSEESRVRQRYVDLIVRPQARDGRPPANCRHSRITQRAGATRLFGSRNADAADFGRRRGGPPVRHALQCARHRSLPSDRAGTVPEALRRRRVRQGLRT